MVSAQWELLYAQLKANHHSQFKRPHTSKTSSPLRSSDARKIREELSTDFYLDPALVKILLPDVNTHKITTHLGEPCQIYSPSSSGNPLFFRHEKGALIPTCYAFDLLPELLPTLVTAPQVVEHLISGAGKLLQTGLNPEGADHAVLQRSSPPVSQTPACGSYRRR